MSDRKDVKKPHKAPLSSIAKTQVGSSQKKTAVKSRLHEDVRSQKKNLIPEFEKASKQEVGKKLFVEVEVEEEGSGSVSVDSMISSHVTSEVGGRAAMSELGENAALGSSGFDFQLPRSYIIAMSGLQEAVGQREGEIRKLKGDLEKRKEQIVTLSGELDRFKDREQER